MLSNKERKLSRMESGLYDVLSPSIYNLLIGGIIFYGLAINCLCVYFLGDFAQSIPTFAITIGYVICCIIGVFMGASHSPIVSFIGYNLVVIPIGFVLASCLPYYMLSDIQAAFTVTTIIVLIMTFAATIKPNWFAHLGFPLFLVLFGTFLAEMIALLLHYNGLFFDILCAGLFSLYIGYDWYRAQRYPKVPDYAVDSAMDIYMDIINLFLRLLTIFARHNDDNN